jgi:GxxExxY protein
VNSYVSIFLCGKPQTASGKKRTRYWIKSKSKYLYPCIYAKMQITKRYLDNLTYQVIGCAIEVHKILGPGLLESVYEKYLLRELTIHGLAYKNQLNIPLTYKGQVLEMELRCDVLVEDVLLVELKAVDSFLAVHEAVLLSYMRMLRKPKGILINFHCTNIFKAGQKTLVNELFAVLPMG